MLSWLILTTLEVSVLIGVVLVARPLLRRAFGAVIAGDLWLIPLIGALSPMRPPRPETALETIPLPGAAVSREVYSAAEAWEGSSATPWLTLWLAGVAVWVAVQLVRSAHFRSVLRSTAAPFVAASPAVSALLNLYGVAEARVCTTTLAGAPFVAGLLRAKVFLPADFARRFSEQEQQWILVHELTHLKRGDLWARLVAEAFRAVFWFNPLAHLAVQLLRQDQEFACDQAVVSRCTPQERYCYGRALVLGSSPQSAPSSLTFFSNNKERYAMLSKHRESAFNSVVGGVVCTLIGVLSLTSSPTSIAQGVVEPAWDFSLTTELQADVHQVRFVANADATMRVMVRDQAGKSQEWTVVLGDAKEMREAGVNLVSFAPGYGYVIAGHPSRDPAQHLLLATNVTRPDGSVWRR
jgi:beta-lactamase regulating signal transducer with metallopeptidase domain